MARVLVTGGHGFLGRNLVAHLREGGDEVKVFTRPSSGSPATDNGEPGIHHGDIRDAEAVSRAVAGSEIVVHLVSNFRSPQSDGKGAHEINVGGTRNVLAACREHGVERLVHCSTIGVHGDVDEIPAGEETRFNPGDDYQRTKLIAERAVRDHHRRTGLPVSVVRPISLFGPDDRRMLKLFRMIDAGWFVRVGSGDVLFHPAYIDDVVRGFALCMRHPDAVGEVFIIGGDEYVTLNELVRIIADELGARPRTLTLPMKPVLAAAALCEAAFAPFGVEPPLHRRRVSFYQNDRAFSIDKARRMLGYEPRVSLSEGMRRTAEGYRERGWL